MIAGAAASAGPLAPGAWLGVVGGGQLGRMFCHAAQRLGFRTVVLDPDASGPAGSVADACIAAGYGDRDALTQLAAACAAVTVEFENVPADSLAQLARALPVRPGAQAVAIAQDRLREKAFIASCGVPVAPHAPLCSEADAAALSPQLFPALVKTARLGYDGKGQIAAAGPAQALAAWQALGGVACVVEKRLALVRELSVVVARDASGALRTYAPSQNEHRDGILAVSLQPARVDAATAARACELAGRIASALQYEGVLCVELFELADGTLCVNEMAPRPHNSGHATIDACAASQFEQQVRVLAGLPLADPAQHSHSVMLNLLGDLWFPVEGGPARVPDFPAILALPGVCLHLYGKEEARPGRKMGHVTVLAADSAGACRLAVQVAQRLGLSTRGSEVLAGVATGGA